MSLTPAEIYNRRFKKSLRGYDTQEVDDFLELVAVYYEEIISNKTQLESLSQELRSELDKYNQLQQSIDETVNKANRFAENKKEEANQEARLILEQAKQKAKDIIAGAEAEADTMIKEARLEAKQLLMEAREQAEEKYKQYQQLLESERLFKIRFKTLLQSHLEMLEEDEEVVVEDTDLDSDNEEVV